MSVVGGSSFGSSGSKSKADYFPSGEDVGAFVLDIGQLWVRAGNAGEDCPKHYAYSTTAVPQAALQNGQEDKQLSGDTEMTPAGPSERSPVPGPTFGPSGLLNGSSTLSKRIYPVSYSRLQENIDVRPCLFQPSKREAGNSFTSWEHIAQPVEPLELDAEGFESIVNHIFSPTSGLRSSLEGKPIIVTEPNKHNRRVRERMAEILFETFKAEAVYTAKKAVLNAFAVGRSGGLVVDIGSDSTSICPVQEGYILQRNILEIPAGGNLMDYQLACLLKAVGADTKVVPIYSVSKVFKVSPNTPLTLDHISSVDINNCCASFIAHSRRELLRQMKEAISRVSDDPLLESEVFAPLPSGVLVSRNAFMGLGSRSSGFSPTTPHYFQQYYELPDGSAIHVEPLAARVPECLLNFNCILGRDGDQRAIYVDKPSAGDGSDAGPENGSTTQKPTLPESFMGTTGLPHAIARSVLACDVDARRDLLSALIVCGGGSLTPGLPERISRQLQENEGLFGTGIKYRVVSPSSTLEKHFLSWIGGSILASLASFQQMWMSSAEYAEHGASLLERRCV